MVVGRAALASLLLLGACVPERAAEKGNWYSSAGELDVEEPVEFTDQPYSYPASGPGFGDFDLPPPYTTWFAPDDPAPAGCDDWIEDTSDSLPTEHVQAMALS